MFYYTPQFVAPRHRGTGGTPLYVPCGTIVSRPERSQEVKRQVPTTSDACEFSPLCRMQQRLLKNPLRGAGIAEM